MPLDVDAIKATIRQAWNSAKDWISDGTKSVWEKCISAKRRMVAYSQRYGFLIFWFLLASALFASALIYLKANPQNSLLPAALVHRLFPKNVMDSWNANLYYLANIVLLPLQSFFLLIGGLYAWRTLSQNRKFKQHEVEASCIRDYLAIERQLAEAGNDRQKIETAVRAYWILMIYEYYWWRHGLLSRDLFAVWCEFRVQHFRKNPRYAFGAPNPGNPLQFTTYREGYNFCKTEKVFRAPSKFDTLMLTLMERANSNTDDLRWHHIERFRHGWSEVF
jgi:hypothetical protein